MTSPSLVTPAVHIDRLITRIREFARERDWQKFHSPKNLTMALTVEAGELQEHFQWLTEAESYQLDDPKRTAVSHEMADVLVYLLRLSDQLDIDLFAAVDEKMQINAEKYPPDKVRGSAKKYHEYD